MSGTVNIQSFDSKGVTHIFEGVFDNYGTVDADHGHE